MHRFWIVLLVGCGRIGFDPSGGSPIDAAVDDVPPDVRIDAPTGTPVTVTFGETGSADYANVTADTYLDGSAPEMNHGIGVELEINATPVLLTTLLRFDLRAIPATAIVTSASLALTVTNPGVDAQIDGFRVLQGWLEGVAFHAAGFANFNSRVGPPATIWPGPGCTGASRDPVSLFTVLPPIDNGQIVVTPSLVIVQDWVGSPPNNHGLVLAMTSGTDGIRIASSEYTSGGIERRPLLTVTYVEP